MKQKYEGSIYPRAFEGIPRARKKHLREILNALLVNSSVLVNNSDLRAMLAIAEHDGYLLDWREEGLDRYRISRPRIANFHANSP